MWVDEAYGVTRVQEEHSRHRPVPGLCHVGEAAPTWLPLGTQADDLVKHSFTPAHVARKGLCVLPLQQGRGTEPKVPPAPWGSQWAFHARCSM